jgi:hypothetical protein
VTEFLANNRPAVTSGGAFLIEATPINPQATVGKGQSALGDDWAVPP